MRVASGKELVVVEAVVDAVLPDQLTM